MLAITSKKVHTYYLVVTVTVTGFSGNFRIPFLESTTSNTKLRKFWNFQNTMKLANRVFWPKSCPIFPDFRIFVLCRYRNEKQNLPFRMVLFSKNLETPMLTLYNYHYKSLKYTHTSVKCNLFLFTLETWIRDKSYTIC